MRRRLAVLAALALLTAGCGAEEPSGSGPPRIPDLVLPKWPAEINQDSVSTIAELAESEGVLRSKPDIAELMP
ncbi:hypothetical protein [Actinophytocola sp. NPDC049390]|uniref:hypothetical protein n=1 Tax=Actinophytocola sp. NPDC049390 TaxID=3363894 RepID=UPI0037B8C014